jgi:PAS domain S-box-containing protein
MERFAEADSGHVWPRNERARSHRRTAVVALAILLFLGVYLLRIADSDSSEAALALFVVPIVLCAVEFGTRGGIAAALFGLALTVANDISSDVTLGPVGYLARGAAFVLPAVFLGRFVAERRKLERRTARYQDTSLDLIATAGFDGYFKQLNPAWEKTLGYTQSELRSLPFIDYVHPDDRERTLAEAAQLSSAPSETINFRNRYRTSDGSYRWLDWNARSDPDEGLIYAIARDITDRKEAEEAVEATKQEAERANRAKSEFLSRMSHELRTPLNAILGFGQLLEMGSLEAEQREHVARILTGGRHLLELIDEVLDISRIEAGSMPISLEPVHVGAAISNVLELVAPLAANSGISLEGPPPEAADRYVMADNQRLRQVLLNLLSNAIKYNREEGSATVSIEQVSPDCLLILVTDTGKGIPEAEQAKLFSPFERLGAEQTSIEGTGLGLALSKLLVEAMGGTLGVESQPWIGATFVVKLALAQAPLDVAEPALIEPEWSSADESEDTRTVLYVEDNLSNYKLVERILAARPNIELVTAMEGKLALELAQQHQPDLILLDLHLPGMSGDAVLERLKDDPRTQDIPVVVVSADATEKRIEALLAGGASAYITKPLDIKRFITVVEDTLSERIRG